jgi:TatD DNase family protein
MIIDSHCHLDDPSLEGEIDDVISRAGHCGVDFMLTISTEVRRFERVRALAEKYDNIYCTVGTHPHHAAKEPDVSADELVELTAHPKVVGIGETGLDYHYDNSPRDVQVNSFKVHIDAAIRTGLPLVIHSREAEEDTADIIEEGLHKGPFTPLLHCFSSDRSLATRGLAAGAYISFSGILTFNAAEEIRKVAAEVPLDRILVETDAPYLAPVPHRGKRNEPAYVVHTARRLAELRGLPEQEINDATSHNFFTLFSKIQRPRNFERRKGSWLSN